MVATVNRAWRAGEGTVVERVEDRADDGTRVRPRYAADGRVDGFDRYTVHRVVRRQKLADSGERLPPPVSQPRPVAIPTGLVPIDVEQLVGWAIRTEKVAAAVEHGIGLHDLEAAFDGVEIVHCSGDGVAAVERIGRLGTRVSGPGWKADKIHADAETVWAALQRLDAPRRQLVVRHARRNDRPELPPVPRLLPARAHWDHGRQTWERVGVDYDRSWDRSRNWGACPLIWRPSPAEIDGARVLWRWWREALFAVAAELRAWHAVGQARLVRWYPLDPVVPAEPWVGFPTDPAASDVDSTQDG